MSLFMDDVVVSVNDISFDKQLLNVSGLCSTIMQMDSTQIEILSPYVHETNMILLRDWITIVKENDINTWKPEYIGSLLSFIGEERTIMNLMKKNRRSMDEINLLVHMSQEELIQLINFLDYMQCTDFLDICCFLYACRYQVEEKTNHIKNINIARRIATYLVNPHYVLVDWVDTSKLDWNYLCENPYAIDLLEQNKDKINWYVISENPNAIDLLEQNLEKINWNVVSRNPNAIQLLETHMERIDWYEFSENPNAIELLLKHPEKIYWPNFCRNVNIPFDVLLANKHKINRSLSANPNVVPFLEQHMDVVDWGMLSANPNAIHILRDNIEKINWRVLSENPNAIDLLLEHKERVSSDRFARNPTAVPYLQEYPAEEFYFICHIAHNPNAGELMKQNRHWMNHLMFNWQDLSRNPCIFTVDEDRYKTDMEEFVIASM